VPNTAFKDVVRHLEYDVAELAIVTYLQAKSHGKPLMLLPAVAVRSLPHPFLVYNTERGGSRQTISKAAASAYARTR
jgi:4,5-dihydroxyphthalate decarboxylase